MKLNDNVRNLLIVLAIAAFAVAFTGGGTALRVAIQAVSLGFLFAIAWIGSRLYREHRVTIYSLGERRRAILYIAIGVITLTYSASSRLFATGTGTVAWIALVAGSAFALYAVFRAAREY